MEMPASPVDPSTRRRAFLKDLDPQQFEAATAPGGPHCVLAPAGSGKTRVLVARALHLLETGAHPHQVLLLAFNRKAVGELRARLSPLAVGLRVHTFHSFALSLLPDRRKLRVVSNKEIRGDGPGSGPRILFSEMIPRAASHLRNNPAALETLRRRFPFVLVDEYQDLNQGQHDLIQLMNPGPGFFAVGDDDQCIYAWRGARLDPLLGFPKAGLHTLSLNYRSGGHIVATAARILEPIQNRHPKTLSSASGEPGAVWAICQTRGHALVGASAKALSRLGGPWEDTAILARKQHWLLHMASGLSRQNIPVKTPPAAAFLRSPLGCDLAGLLALARSPNPLASPIPWLLEQEGFPLPRRHRHGLVTLGNLWEKYPEIRGGPVGHLYGKFLRGLSLVLETLSRPRLGLAEAAGCYQKHLGAPFLWQAHPRGIPLRKLEGAAFARLIPPEIPALDFPHGPFCPPRPGVGVTFASIHGAKGLEYHTALCHRFAEGPLDDMERRLYYVALTRARRQLLISFSPDHSPEAQQTFGPPKRWLDFFWDRPRPLFQDPKSQGSFPSPPKNGPGKLSPARG